MTGTRMGAVHHLLKYGAVGIGIEQVDGDPVWLGGDHTRQGLRFKAPKNERARAVKLPAFAVDELRRFKRSQAETKTIGAAAEDGGGSKNWRQVAADRSRQFLRQSTSRPSARIHST